MITKHMNQQKWDFHLYSNKLIIMTRRRKKKQKITFFLSLHWTTEYVMLLLRDKNVGNGMAGTKMLQEKSWAPSWELSLAWTRAPPFPALYFPHSRASAQWSCFHTQAQHFQLGYTMLRSSRTSWSLSTPTAEPMRSSIPGCFSSPSARAAASPRPAWSQGSWFHLSSFWLFQALWWHHYRFLPTQAA